jgi:hypothetical protein
LKHSLLFISSKISKGMNIAAGCVMIKELVRSPIALSSVGDDSEEIGSSGGFGTAVLDDFSMIPTSKLQRFLVLLSVSSGWLLLMSTAARANSWPPMAVGLFYLQSLEQSPPHSWVGCSDKRF